ncbi:hypothetical protein, partial [Xanthomonas axonopodis]|uniref:hypothetical protein n=1 Tax=Xanthomonas axonopodis TaxID=53413 RepID=UPI001CA5B907
LHGKPLRRIEVQRRQLLSSRGVDEDKKPASMAGCASQKPSGFKRSDANTSKPSVDGKKKSAIMGGSLWRKRRG